MKVSYHADTDQLYIDLADRPSVESREVSQGVVLDYDEQGRVVGIDIEAASTHVELRELILDRLPAEVRRTAA